MGNCVALCKPNSGCSIASGMRRHVKVVRVAKPDGKILEFGSPIHVTDVLTKFPAYGGIGGSKKATKSLSQDHELKVGRLYYLLPALSNGETSGGIKRIKFIITKHQLEKLVTKQISIDDILSEVQTFTVNFPSNQKPKLDSIPEENE